MREELGRRRLPFYRFLRENYSGTVEHFGVTDALDTLDLVVNRSDDATLQGLLSNAVGPNAKEYGFTRVRFYVPNPPGSADPTTLIAEASYDGAGRWNTFKK